MAMVVPIHMLKRLIVCLSLHTQNTTLFLGDGATPGAYVNITSCTPRQKTSNELAKQLMPDNQQPHADHAAPT